MVRNQKCGKSKPNYARPQAPPVRQNIRPVEYNIKYAQHQQQQHQQQHQHYQEQQVLLLRKELVQLREQQERQHIKELEKERRQEEQQQRLAKQIAQLQKEHERGLHTIKKLEEDRAILKQKLTEGKDDKDKDVVKKDTSVPLSVAPESAKMNGNTAGASASAGAGADSRKSHLRPILGNSAPMRPAAVHHPKADPGPAIAGNKRQPHPRVTYPGGTRTGGGISVNYRLKQQQTAALAAPMSPPLVTSSTDGLLITPPDSPENAYSNKTASSSSSTHRLQNFNGSQPLLQNIQTGHLNVDFQFDPAYDAVSSLKQYCVAQGYAPPRYECYPANRFKRLHCKVHLGDGVYTSYPEDHPDEATAKQRTSEVAVERLRELLSRKKLMVIKDDEFLDALYQELIKHPHGIVSHKLPEWYEATVKRQVPSNWWSLITESPKIRIESSVNTNIVFANTAPSGRSQLQQLSVGNDGTMPELQLPWSDGQQDWSMYVTHCDNTMHVWARLIDQSANFEKLTEQLNAQMSRPQNRQPVQQEPIEHEIYLVEVSENWNRVRVISLDGEQRQCSCHFVDYGDEVNFGYDTLYLCPPHFLSLPAQAVCLSMYALDKFEEHPHAHAVLAKELAGHSVVTRIITSEAQFHQSGGCTQGVLLKGQDEENGCAQPSKRRACIVGTFYDTSTSEDIHLNDLVANQIIRNTPAPLLKLDQKSNHVIVSHVNDVGDLMVQLPNDDLKFVQRSIARIMSDSSEQHRVRYSDLLHDQLVCVCDESGDGVKQWYRGMLTAKPKSPEEEVFDVYYVDDGRLRKTHISNIYRLEANNLALAAYPAQALRVRLHDVPPIDNQMLGRLRGLLSPQTSALLKVMEGASDKLPMVTIHARGQDSLYLCLNSAIRMEYEVQSTTRLEPFDDGGLHFSPSGQLIRRSSFSSTVSSHSSCGDQPPTVGLASPTSTPLKQVASLLPVLKEYEAIPAVGSYFEVRVALSVNPGRFAVQPYKCYNQLQRLMKDLQAHCKSSAAKQVEPSQLAIGQAYVAADADGIYHRVNIRKTYDEMIQVRYVDVGDDGVVRCNQLLHLPVEFRELPMMSLPAQLHGIQLADIDWTQENCVRFRQLTLGQKFIGVVWRVDKLKDERRALSLELIDTSTPQDIKVHETLISEKHALPAP